MLFLTPTLPKRYRVTGHECNAETKFEKGNLYGILLSLVALIVEEICSHSLKHLKEYIESHHFFPPKRCALSPAWDKWVLIFYVNQ